MRSALRIRRAQRSHGHRSAHRETHQNASSPPSIAGYSRLNRDIGSDKGRGQPSAQLSGRKASRTITIAAAALLSLSGCVIAERPPSAALPCDPALVGDWLLDASYEWGSPRQRRLRIDAKCRAYLPREYTPRQIDLRIYQAGEHRYIGLAFLDTISLLDGKDAAREALTDPDYKPIPQSVSLLRYSVEAQSLTIYAGNEEALSDVVANRDASEGIESGPDDADLLTGNAAQIRKQLLEHPELYERPDTDGIYRFNRIAPAKR